MKRSIIIIVLAVVAIITIIPFAAFAQNFQIVSNISIPNNIRISDMKISGNYAYVITYDSHELIVVDFWNSTTPIIRNRIPIPGANHICLAGNYAFITAGSHGLKVIDISNPNNLPVVGSYSDSLVIREIWIGGSYAYIAANQDTQFNSISILNIANPQNPTFFSSLADSEYIGSIIGTPDILFTTSYHYLKAYNITYPSEIYQINQDTGFFGYGGSIIQNNLLFLLTGEVAIYDISTPVHFYRAGTVPQNALSISVSNNTIFLTTTNYNYNILYAYDLSNHALPLWSARQLYPIQAIEYQAVCARHDTAFVAGNSFFAIFKLMPGSKGALEGYVLDSYTGLPVENAGVFLEQNNIYDTTDALGYFIFRGLYNLSYTLRITHPDYITKIDSSYLVVANDTTTYNITLQRLDNRAAHDLMIYGILSPKAAFEAPSNQYLKAGLWNNGTETAYNFNVIYEVYLKNNPIPILADTAFFDSLIPSRGNEIIFKRFDAIPDTVYNFIAYTALANDEIPSNDTARLTAISYSYGVDIWYGNPNSYPKSVIIGDTFSLDVYVKTMPGVRIATLVCVLGIDDQYIDSLMSNLYGQEYYPLTEWDDASFLNPVHSPPNQLGWSAETFLGFWDLKSSNPWLQIVSPNPTKILTMVMRAAFDSSLTGSMATAFGYGLHTTLGSTTAGDPERGPGYRVREHYCPLYFVKPCDYALGDINGDGHPIGGDVTYAVRYFKSQGPPPVDSCFMDSTGSWFYPAGDVNGNCEFRGSDVTRMVAYFKSAASLSYCHFFPPGQTGRR